MYMRACLCVYKSANDCLRLMEVGTWFLQAKSGEKPAFLQFKTEVICRRRMHASASACMHACMHAARSAGGAGRNSFEGLVCQTHVRTHAQYILERRTPCFIFYFLWLLGAALIIMIYWRGGCVRAIVACVCVCVFVCWCMGHRTMSS